MSTDTTTAGTTPTSSGRHRLEVGHLVMGLAFLGFVAAWAVAQSGLVGGADLRWLLPLPWLVAGAVGLTAIAVGSLRRRDPVATGATDTDTDLRTDRSGDSTDTTLTDIMEEQR